MKALVGLGANLGNRLETLQRTILELAVLEGTKVLRQSSMYETEPVGGSVQPYYLNAVVEIETGLSPKDLMNEFLLIEKKEGRVRTVLNAPRTLDIDLLFFGQEIIDEEGLTVPHPRLHLRKFTLIPLAEIAPDYVHPLLAKTVRELLEMNASSEAVLKWDEQSAEKSKVR